MKTPRELLLARHADAEAELNTIRRAVVADLRPAKTAGWLAAAWRELVWQPRLIWGGLAAVWVLILGGNAGEGPVRQAVAPVVSAESFRQQRALYAEFGLLRRANPVATLRRPGPQSRMRQPQPAHSFA